MKILTISLILFPTLGTAAVYKCTDNGRIAYQSSPCAQSTSEPLIKSQSVLQNEEPTPKNQPSSRSTQLNPDDIFVHPIEIQNERAGLVDFDVAAKVLVRNNSSQDIKVVLRYNGVDKKRFKIKQITMNGLIPAKQMRELTERIDASLSDLSKIDQWVLQEKKVYDPNRY